jgi:hypothetical protein
MFLFFKGNHSKSISFKNEKELKVVKDSGLLIFRVDTNIIEDLRGAFELFEAFYQENSDEVAKLIAEFGGFEWKKRTKGVIHIDWNQVHSGDFLAITKLLIFYLF